MILRLHSIFIPFNADQEKQLRTAVQKRLGRYASHSGGFSVSRRSIDGRHRPIRFVYSVDVQFDKVIPDDIRQSVIPNEPAAMTTSPGTAPLLERPVIVGGGPAGLFAALLLSEHGYRPYLIERGGTVEERINTLKSFSKSRLPNPENNALFGLGGAGTFSDGKLRTGVNHHWIQNVLQVLVECGAPKDILIDAKPHIGTDILQHVVKQLVARIESHGGTVQTGVRLDGVDIKNRQIQEIQTSNGPLPCRTLILAIGHSARDTWQMLESAGVPLSAKPFQLGIRIEHPQAWIDQKRYGNDGGDPRLGAADYKLAAKISNTPVFSFCMCPGGETMPTVNEPERLTINGMSLSRRNSPFSSSGMVVTLQPEQYGGGNVFQTLQFQRDIESKCYEAGGADYTAPAQRLGDFVNGTESSTLPKTSYRLGIHSAPLHALLPPLVAGPLRAALMQFDKKMKGYLHKEALALAPESRASSPIRIIRDANTLESTEIKGLFPVGEGAGYAGGITSAALDGLNAAEKIISSYSPPK